jgi:hypothetical protein
MANVNENPSVKNKIKTYWDAWITEWYKKCVLEEQLDRELEEKLGNVDNQWKIPQGSLGNVTTDIYGQKHYEPAYKYLPEPYWGNINAVNPLQCIFLNINPGAGGGSQLFGSDVEIQEMSEFIRDNRKKFEQPNFEYSKLTEEYWNQPHHKTTEWMMNKRVKWLVNMDNAEGDNDQKINKWRNSLFFDLVPWHTPSKVDITQYCRENAEAIINHVLKPISRLGAEVNGRFENKIIVRGSTILEILNIDKFKDVINVASIKNYVILDGVGEKPLRKLSSLLTEFKLMHCPSTFYVFSGGASMMLPNPEYKVYSVGCYTNSFKEGVTLKDFFQKNSQSKGC